MDLRVRICTLLDCETRRGVCSKLTIVNKWSLSGPQ